MKLIGIHGLAGSGKDTLANYLCEKHEFVKIAFATPLKETLTKMFGVNPKYYDDQALKNEPLPYWGFTARQSMQAMGQMSKAMFGQDVWLKRWFLTYQLLSTTDNIVASDVRFDLEANAIRFLGGTVIHLHRDGAGLSGPEGQDISEQRLPVVAGDLVITNNGTLDEMFAQASACLALVES